MGFSRGKDGGAIPISQTGIAAIPTSSTSITTAAVKLRAAILSNPTGSAVNVTFRSGGVGGTVVATLAVPANGAIAFPPANCGDGILFPTGISWNAASSGLFGEVIAST